MALSSSFKDRLKQMEATRNQRLSLLQTEKEVQNKKSETLASKLSEIRYIEQKCLKLEQKIASQQFIISSIKSQLDRIDSIYLTQIHQFRVLKSEVEDLEELDKEKDKYYALKAHDIDEFRAQAEKFETECEKRVGALRNCLNELNFSFVQLQKNAGCSENDELIAAEMRKFELQAVKENLDRKLASNYETKAQLQKQLRRILISQNKRREPHHVG
uniref:uncharacterized protein LOC122611196 n=1 Tax=Erigeron canadensis TaxID=72917 RepID=UPI001CB8DAD4|nr:uncharacterized protein LOC122611196 [Erigeron canadensis]XP_043640115.1 uncharacterized protein LOC122611196 [Erigeron canadensis]XP_043640116.1 uncharacterized protein LOC122611196 [Erigeron canadensis]